LIDVVSFRVQSTTSRSP